MATKIFLNLAVKDLKKSVDFFTKVGYTFNPQFTDESATCMIISEDIYVMLLVEKRFKDFIETEICDTSKATESIICLSAESKDMVNEIVKKAVDAGGKALPKIEDHGWMYGHGYHDLDGHHWEVAWMDMSAFRQE